MAAAIKPVEPAENQFLAEVERKIGRPVNMYRAMAHHPEALERFVPLYKSIIGPGAVDRRLKELLYLAVSYANECPYCTAGHLTAGRRVGVTEEEERALQTLQDHAFSDAERAAIRYVRELTQTAAVDETAAELAEHFSSGQIVEITLVAALANFTNRFNNALGVEPED